ncbi:hypothetical protein DHEL01_v200267 [Diaporthe helianthi]|uniref:Uncharacterized protein n=1 Tax=Diaporthe helianthi TaxID=158607 RepID=A0A2P5IFP9_DIAHE|nr:hypothetical protein DHEL01_v200267 [Diaporthe helianthi]
MGDDDRPQDGDTGTTASQTPAKPDVQVGMLARNNLTRAFVFGQPSERKSTSGDLPSTPSSIFVAANSQSPFANIRASTAANNANSQAKASQTSPQLLPCVPANLDTPDDDQALAILMKNKTVTGLLQNAFNTRVEEHQRKVERAYNERLLELEEYTRSWRDTTKELWLAVRKGTSNFNKDEWESLRWKGPQDAGHDFDPERPMKVQEVVEKELGSDETVTCTSSNEYGAFHTDPHFNLLNWTNNSGCGSKDFKTFAHQIVSFLKTGSPRLVFRHETKFGTIKYRSITSVESTIHKVNKTDVVIELTPPNVALLGKAFCYLKDTNDRIFQQVNTDCEKSVSAAELSFIFDRFSREPTKRFMDILPLYDGNHRVSSDLFAVNINISAIPKRLLIARPRYSIDGNISGAKFFDVASGAYTARQESGIVPVSFGATTPALSPSGSTSAEAGYKSTGLRSDQVSHHTSAGIVPDLTQSGPSQEWITDIKGTATDFTSLSSPPSLLMGSSYLEDEGLSKFLKTPPSCGRVLFRHPDSVQNYTYLSWKDLKHENNPELTCADIVVELTHQNMFLLWKAFCFLRDRSNYLFSKIAGPLSEVSRKAFDDLNEKLDRHYRGSLPPKRQRRFIRSLLLPRKASSEDELYETQAVGAPFNRRLVIARPYHQGKRVIGAEFFDAGSGRRKTRVSAEQIIITEETTTLEDLGRLLEKTIQMGVFPATGQGHATTNITPEIELPGLESGVVPKRSQNEVPEQSGNSFHAARSLLDANNTLRYAGLEQQKATPVSKSAAPPQPLLFQRTLDLSNSLDELRDGPRRAESNPAAHGQWLAIGGEAQDVRSPSPKWDRNSIANYRSHPRVVEDELLLLAPTNQQTHDTSSDGIETSDLIMLDEQPEGVTFRCRRKRRLPAAGQKAQMAKRAKPS